MKIEAIESACYRLPLEGVGDAGHGAIDSMFSLPGASPRT